MWWYGLSLIPTILNLVLDSQLWLIVVHKAFHLLFLSRIMLVFIFFNSFFAFEDHKIILLLFLLLILLTQFQYHLFKIFHFPTTFFNKFPSSDPFRDRKSGIHFDHSITWYFRENFPSVHCRLQFSLFKTAHFWEKECCVHLRDSGRPPIYVSISPFKCFLINFPFDIVLLVFDIFSCLSHLFHFQLRFFLKYGCKSNSTYLRRLS